MVMAYIKQNWMAMLALTISASMLIHNLLGKRHQRLLDNDVACEQIIKSYGSMAWLLSEQADILKHMAELLEDSAARRVAFGREPTAEELRNARHRLRELYDDSMEAADYSRRFQRRMAVTSARNATLSWAHRELQSIALSAANIALERERHFKVWEKHHSELVEAVNRGMGRSSLVPRSQPPH